jgi:centromere protein C
MRSAPSRRASTVNGAGPSALSKSFSVYNDSPGQDPAPDPDFEPANQDFDYEPPENDTPSRAGVSFNHANYEDEEENDAAEVEEEVASRAKSVNKGKQRAVVEAEQQEEDRIEDDIAQGLEEVENAPDEEEEVEEDPPPKKFRKDNQKEQKPKKPRARAPKRAITMTEESTFYLAFTIHSNAYLLRFTSTRRRPPQSTVQVQTT